jgi:hypothetical protein
LNSEALSEAKRQALESLNLPMRITLFAFLLLTIQAKSQFSAYDPFDDNVNQWIIINTDSAEYAVREGVLDMTAKIGGDYINAKEGVVDLTREFRCEIRTEFYSGADTMQYGICWGASDVNTYHFFYITPAGRYGFRTRQDNKWTDVILPVANPAINKKGSNWLRVSAVVGLSGGLELHLCINELVVDRIRSIRAFGPFFGACINNKGRILFDDFIVYQRGALQEEFEPSDLALSLQCRFGQFRYTNTLYGWSCCVQNGCRVDVDSVITRFWYSDMRAGDYSVLVAPYEAATDGDFLNAVQRDFIEYVKDTVDPIIPLKAEKATAIIVGNEKEVIQVGQIYTAVELTGNMYIRRYYVNHPYADKSGMMFQFILPENSPHIPTLDALVRDVISSLQFR